MSEYDLHSNIGDRIAIALIKFDTNTTTPGEIIDTSGFESIEYIVQSGEIVGGSYAILLEEGDDAGLSDVATVSADDILGTIFGFFGGVLDTNRTIRIGSIGKKRYQRISLVSTGVVAESDGVFVGIAILGHPHTAPVPQLVPSV